MSSLYISYMETPMGLMDIHASPRGIRAVNHCAEKSQPEYTSPFIDQCKTQLGEYFAGARQVFDLPLDQQGSDFQLAVWQVLTTIPFGQTASYGEIARLIDNPKSVRAVGGANNKNSLSIIVPCHRVIGGDGALVGYAGGLERKRWLLKHEGILLGSDHEQIALF